TFTSPKLGWTGFGLSADGKTLATASKGEREVRVWDVGTGKELSHGGGLSDAPEYVALSPEGKTVATAGGEGRRIQLWNAATGKELFPSHGHMTPLSLVSLPSDGKTVVTVSEDRTARVWDLPTAKTVREIDLKAVSFLRAAVSPDGKL